MKKLTYISGALFSSLFLIACLFKILNLMGATSLLVISLSGLAFVFVPAFAKYQYDKDGK